MKKAIMISLILILISCPSVFAGTADKIANKCLPTVGLIDTSLREAPNSVVNNEIVSGLRKVTKPIGILASAKDIAMVGTTAVAVSGSSGSAIVSSVAAIGKPVATLVGGTVSATAAGLAVAPGCAGLGSAGLLNEFVFNGDSEADQAAQIGTYTGALGATAGGVATVAAAGTAGLSAAGITSGLAAIGGVVGGGMAAGAIIVVVAPVAAATAIGGLAYWLFSD